MEIKKKHMCLLADAMDAARIKNTLSKQEVEENRENKIIERMKKDRESLRRSFESAERLKTRLEGERELKVELAFLNKYLDATEDKGE